MKPGAKAWTAWWDRLYRKRCVYSRGRDRGGLAEINHARSVPCSPRILDEHYPVIRAATGRQPGPAPPVRRRSWRSVTARTSNAARWPAVTVIQVSRHHFFTGSSPRSL